MRPRHCSPRLKSGGYLVSSPEKVWTGLQEGNQRFTTGSPTHPSQDADRRAAIAGKQTPTAALFGCSDSRISAEIIFDVGLGELFVVRNAGHIVSDSVLASLEYAVEILGVSVIVVLAHDDCGALHAAIELDAGKEPDYPPKVSSLVTQLQPAIERTRLALAKTTNQSLNADAVAGEHLKDTLSRLLAGSELLGQKIADGRLGLVGARYRLVEGLVQPEVMVGDFGQDDGFAKSASLDS